jgi:REP element-mobilizing transposase RayT
MAIISYYRRNLPHIQIAANSHFVTFCTRKREILPFAARDIVLACCIHENKRRVKLIAAVVMPDHVHMVLTPYSMNLLTKVLGEIKSAATHKINKSLGTAGALWQEESFDHSIRSEESLWAKVAYVLQNPVRAGIVRTAGEYKWTWTEDPDFISKFLLPDSAPGRGGRAY